MLCSVRYSRGHFLVEVARSTSVQAWERLKLFCFFALRRGRACYVERGAERPGLVHHGERGNQKLSFFGCVGRHQLLFIQIKRRQCYIRFRIGHKSLEQQGLTARSWEKVLPCEVFVTECDSIEEFSEIIGRWN